MVLGSIGKAAEKITKPMGAVKDVAGAASGAAGGASPFGGITDSIFNMAKSGGAKKAGGAEKAGGAKAGGAKAQNPLEGMKPDDILKMGIKMGMEMAQKGGEQKKAGKPPMPGMGKES